MYSEKNSWRWTEELSETCRASFQEQIWEISASSWFYYKKYIKKNYNDENIQLKNFVLHNLIFACFTPNPHTSQKHLIPL